MVGMRDKARWVVRMSAETGVLLTEMEGHR